MVGHVQHLARLQVGDVRGSVDGAGEGAVRGREGRFPHLAELVEDVGHGGLVGFVVHEDDGPFAGEDQFGKGGPVVDGERDVRRDVGVSAQAAVFDGTGVVSDVDEIAVAEEDGDDVVGVGLDPRGHVAEVGFDGAGVEEVAGGVAVVECAVHNVRLSLYCVVRNVSLT